MQDNIKWTQVVPGTSKGAQINSIAYSPCGDYIVAACGLHVQVYASSTGTLLYSLKGHENTVYCVDYMSDGQRFLSGGADMTVIIWTNKFEGVLKFRHKASIQALVANPTSPKIASISSVDWAVWGPSMGKVVKHRLQSKGLCGAWTADGQTLAIGMIDGSIITVGSDEIEKVLIRRKHPVWTIRFSSLRENGADVLAVGSWDQSLSFYNLNGTLVGKEHDLGFEPCCISFYDNGEYLILSGSDHKVSLYTKDGSNLLTLTNADSWVWCVQQRPKSNQICCGTNDGTIFCLEVSTSPLQSIYMDQFVYREGMTNVVVYQPSIDRRMVIPCNNYVYKIATFRDRLAVQFKDRIVIFEPFYDDERSMRYHDIAQIRRNLDCKMLCVTGHAVILCKECRITMYDFDGNKRREWVVDSVISFIKVDGGPDHREALLLGLENGQVMKIFIDNPFPTTLITLDAPIRQLDLSSNRMKIAVIDTNSLLRVFDLENKGALLFSEPDTKTVAWCMENDNMIAYTTGTNTLNIKTDTLPAYQQTVQGSVVSFKAYQVYTLEGNNIMTIDVPHANSLYRYIESKDFDSAYLIARLGITESDWKMLGLHAMSALKLDIARKAFTCIHDTKFVELLNNLELFRRQQKEIGSDSGKNEVDQRNVLLGDVLAFQGKFKEAARQYVKAGYEDRAIDMFCDMKMWEDARKVCSDDRHLKDLICQQALWAEESKNYAEAAFLYETSGDYSKAIHMLSQAKDLDKLMKTCRSLPKSEVALITQCAECFKKNGAIPFAIEAYEKVGDNHSLIRIYVETGNWQRAFAVFEKCPQYTRELYVPWANWLAENDKFEEALEAFRAAEWPKETVRMMEVLASNSVTCRKFRDAAFYYIHLANEYGQFEDDDHPSEMHMAALIKQSNECVRRADMYYVYANIYTHMVQPFPYNEIRLYRMSRYLLAMASEGVIPMNIGKAEILCTLARTACRLDMVRTARAVFEKLHSVILAPPILEQVSIETLLARCKRYADRDELLDTCYRCKHVVPQLTDPGDRCPNCYHPFVRSFVNFEVLPLVEFTLSNDLTDNIAEKLIRADLGAGTFNLGGKSDGDSQDQWNRATLNEDANPVQSGKEWSEGTGVNVINFESENIDYEIDNQLIAMGKSKAAANKGDDPFFTQLQYVMRSNRVKGEYQPFVANASLIKSLKREGIFIMNPRYGVLPVPNRYYRLVESNRSIKLCKGCQHFFIARDYEYQCMKGSGCPLCRYNPAKQIGPSLREGMMEFEEIMR
ncbi:unnamed protein product [Phytomonas sp. Hart1]|nr:unnamed protein product [Phytomonas sp. Hart1]|eukprot:CCW67047.1 unnamed protein product [Phytomonas sp. isolate Hart1]